MRPPEIRRAAAPDGHENEAVVEDESQMVEEGPVLSEADPEDSAAQQEQEGEKAHQVELVRGDQDRRAVAADKPEDRNEHRVGPNGQSARADREEPHQREPGRDSDESVEVHGGEDAEVERGDAAADPPAPEKPISRGAAAVSRPRASPAPRGSTTPPVRWEGSGPGRRNTSGRSRSP